MWTPNSASPKTRHRKTLLSSGTTTHHQARIRQAWPARPSLPVRCREGRRGIAYVEDGEVEINEPIAFNMEQEELALHGTHNLYNSLAAGISPIWPHPERIYPQSLVRLQGSGTPVGESSHRTRRELHQRFQGNERKLLLVCPAKHDRQNRTYPRW